MKLYFHLHLPNNVFITAAVKTEAICVDIKSCLQQFSKYLMEKQNLSLNVDNLQLFNDRKEAISQDSMVTSFVDGIDVFVKQVVVDKNKVIYDKSSIIKMTDSYMHINQSSTVHLENNENVAPQLKKAQKFVCDKRHDLALTVYIDILKTYPNNFDALFGIAYIYFKAKRYKDSIPYFEKLISKGLADEVLLLDFSRALVHSGDFSKAVSVISRCINDLKRSNKSADQIHDANVVLGEALESMGQLPNAFQLYLTVSQITEKQHLSALLGYARVGYQIKHISLDDVFIIILNAAAHHKNDFKFNSYFAEMVNVSNGYDTLRKQMHDLWLDPLTVLYISKLLREYGAIQVSLKLAKHAFFLDSSNINIALLIFHLHENLCSDMQGLSVVAEFLNGMLNRQVVRKIDLSPFVKVIQYVEKNDLDQLKMYVCKLLDTEKAIKHSPKGNLSNYELDLLAIYFTIIKVCFANGFLKPLPLFIRLIDPLFNLGDLHKTSISNEQAYYSCIRHIYKVVPPICPMNSSNKLYFVGDSHVLPISWREINGSENNYCVQPVLVTGLKIWHLRKDSRYYTKSCFQKSMELIPEGAACIFVLGEIDCREGVQSAVQECLYNDTDECMKALVEIYVKRLTDVQKKKKAKIFVHPVPPVLNKTICNVMTFNEHLKSRVLKAPKLYWLEFVNELIDEKGVLKEQYQFDGTHLNPSYLTLLESSVKNQL